MNAETSRGTRAGDRARAAKADHQPEASLAWTTSGSRTRPARVGEVSALASAKRAGQSASGRRHAARKASRYALFFRGGAFRARGPAQSAGSPHALRTVCTYRSLTRAVPDSAWETIVWLLAIFRASSSCVRPACSRAARRVKQHRAGWARGGAGVLPQRSGYTPGMKTAISVPEPIFRRAERLAHRLKKSRSQLYSEAVAEYVARRDPEAVTETMNAVCADVDTAPDALLREAARRVLAGTEW